MISPGAGLRWAPDPRPAERPPPRCYCSGIQHCMADGCRQVPGPCRPTPPSRMNWRWWLLF